MRWGMCVRCVTATPSMGKEHVSFAASAVQRVRGAVHQCVPLPPGGCGEAAPALLSACRSSSSPHVHRLAHAAHGADVIDAGVLPAGACPSSRQLGRAHGPAAAFRVVSFTRVGRDGRRHSRAPCGALRSARANIEADSPTVPFCCPTQRRERGLQFVGARVVREMTVNPARSARPSAASCVCRCIWRSGRGLGANFRACRSAPTQRQRAHGLAGHKAQLQAVREGLAQLSAQRRHPARRPPHRGDADPPFRRWSPCCWGCATPMPPSLVHDGRCSAPCYAVPYRTWTTPWRWRSAGRGLSSRRCMAPTRLRWPGGCATGGQPRPCARGHADVAQAHPGHGT